MPAAEAEAFTFEIKTTNLWNHQPDYHVDWPIGYAYETDRHFVFFFAKRGWGPNAGHGVTEGRDGSLEDWIDKHFAPELITRLAHPAGVVVDGVWRPGLTQSDQLLRAFGMAVADQR